MLLWIKALHVIAIISWMAGLLYLPRLFVYHAQTTVSSASSETFKVMERRLFRFIMTPAMLVAWLTGLLLVWLGGYLADGWLHAKLVLVIGLTFSHVHLGRLAAQFAVDKNEKSQKYFRIINEVPTLIMVGIVILVIVKPF